MKSPAASSTECMSGFPITLKLVLRSSGTPAQVIKRFKQFVEYGIPLTLDLLKPAGMVFVNNRGDLIPDLRSILQCALHLVGRFLVILEVVASVLVHDRRGKRPEPFAELHSVVDAHLHVRASWVHGVTTSTASATNGRGP